MTNLEKLVAAAEDAAVAHLASIALLLAGPAILDRQPSAVRTGTASA